MLFNSQRSYQFAALTEAVILCFFVQKGVVCNLIKREILEHIFSINFENFKYIINVGVHIEIAFLHLTVLFSFKMSYKIFSSCQNLSVMEAY